jgi:RES domain-containing protein
MVLWRLSGRQYANVFEGGYGIAFDGRWNTAGHAITYCATSPSLCVLEKLVHVEDPDLLPELVMITYEVPDMLGTEVVELNQLPVDWKRQESQTQRRGDEWHRLRSSPLLSVPSAIVPIAESPDVNVLINHEHPSSAKIAVRRQEPFTFDSRLL